MTEFEPGSIASRSDRCANHATTTALMIALLTR